MQEAIHMEPRGGHRAAKSAEGQVSGEQRQELGSRVQDSGTLHSVCWYLNVIGSNTT